MEAIKWIDVTTHSQGETDRTPRIWRCTVDYLVISVHRHIHYLPDQWLLSCTPFFDNYELPFKDADMAKVEALKLVINRLQKILNELKIIL